MRSQQANSTIAPLRCGQPRQQRHRQRRHAEERRELAVANLGLLVGQDADHAAVLQPLEQLPHRRAFRAAPG